MNIRNKTREDILNLPNKYVLAELPTGFGKSKLALDWLKNTGIRTKILIVVPRLVLIDNWKQEFIKWGYKDYLSSVEFVTYVSFPKKIGHWNAVILDEAHHLSERCVGVLEYFSIKKAILLSATVSKKIKQRLYNAFDDLCVKKITARKAIQEEVLPDPQVILIPLYLDNYKKDCTIIKNKKKGNPITLEYSQRFRANTIKDRKVIIPCTQLQWYNDISSLIAYYKNKMHIDIYKNLYLFTCGERLKWLSNQKTSFIAEILKKVHKERTLTFCNSILQTEVLGKYCINSKNRNALQYKEAFNSGKINHITACNMLNEGVNLTNCKIGIYAALNSSELLIKQKLGRLLRHPNPILIIPYYKNTRDEEIVKKMCEDYNPALIREITSIKELNI